MRDFPREYLEQRTKWLKRLLCVSVSVNILLFWAMIFLVVHSVNLQPLIQGTVELASPKNTELDLSKYSAEDLEDPLTQYKIGWQYAYGNPRTRSYEKANEWFLKSANNGNLKAQYSLGYAYRKGNGVKKDNQQAMYWYKQAAGEGYVKAQYSVAHMHYYGIGMPKDYTKAFEWYGRAAEQDYTRAHVAMGLMYRFGRGTGVSYSKALFHFERAADSEYHQAFYQLGLMHEKGQGVPLSLELAYEFQMQAQALNYKYAKKAIKRIKRKAREQNIDLHS
ncbi:MAG: tetratricopeptide repeat protein [Pseudomonadota bacterium]